MVSKWIRESQPLQKLARYKLQWKSPEKLIERNYSLEISLKNNIQAEKSLCSQTFSLRLLDMSKRKWKVPPLFPVSDIAHLAEMMWFSVPIPQCCSYTAMSTTKHHPLFSSSVQKAWYSEAAELLHFTWKLLSQNRL